MKKTNPSAGIKNHKVVSPSKWLVARKQLLEAEKQFNRLRDQLSQKRRDLPWEKVVKNYVFDTPDGEDNLADLFDGRNQLIIYHFMFDPRWTEGCKHCSFWADNFNGIVGHLKHRDVTMLAISRASLKKLEAFKKRMGWSFKWVSSYGSDFNFDFGVSFKQSDMKSGNVLYNYTKREVPCGEMVGISVFYKNERGDVFHTYSTYSRGVDMLNNAYHYLDLVPKGRDEAELKAKHENPQAWVRYHDK
jgi:predicted dithiol-disulfide oxidoreductase (DUF899 family)